jgi:hypothetical protein
LCEKYERKKRGSMKGTKDITPIHVNVSVEHINPCVTNTPERAPSFRQPNFSEINTAGSAPNQGKETRGASSGSSSEVSTPCGGSS